jgi:V8-like Glu-specific endopeptidase
MRNQFILYILCISAFAASSRAAIFGTDDRVAVTDDFPKIALAKATAIAVLRTFWSDAKPGFGAISGDTLASYPVCKDEKFALDPSISYSCSGFLVAPDLIVTAGHCMVNTGESRNETDTYCQAYGWLFDYRIPSAGKTFDMNAVPSGNFYHCKQVVYAVLDEQAPFRDYALVQLDRPVLDRAPLPLAAGDVQKNEMLTMIGYPFGAPAKYSRAASILLDNPARQSFITGLDAFDGNSGSAVFNSSGKVVGILVGGTPTETLYEDPSGTCQRYNRCDKDGSNCILPDADTSVFPGFQRVGSEVQRIAPVIDLIKRFQAGKG